MKQPEEYYYQKMDRAKQAAYRVMLRGLLDLADEIQIPQIPEPDGAWLYDVFFSFGWIIRRFSGQRDLSTAIFWTRRI